MIKLKNGKKLCSCRTDNYYYDRCDICEMEVERCKDCGLVKASDCEHYDAWTQGVEHQTTSEILNQMISK